MAKRDIMELQKRMRPEEHNITWVATALVEADGTVASVHKERLVGMREEEYFKYLSRIKSIFPYKKYGDAVLQISRDRATHLTDCMAFAIKSEMKLEMDDMWKHGLKGKYHDRLLKGGRITEDFEMPETIIPEIYGKIEKKPDGTLYTTKAQRTGCSMCGFGIHMEKRPHRFDRLYESNPKQWDYLMFHVCRDKDGNDYGWSKVLDYIGVEWDPTTIGGNCRGQISMPLGEMM